ncbi:MAG: hypothetical protein HYS05_19145 [Acidobacteria bacterium]|nr:hypothetical protein [Acidobacteriota bacterium]
MTPNPIRTVLSTLRSHRVQCLLMGGQACVLYGAAEFSRDTDLALLAEPDNLARLREALAELRAECVAVPPFSAEYLLRGHSVHFRCQHVEAAGMRVDVMSVMRGVAPFPELWTRRTTVELEPGEPFDLLSLPDVVAAKKTQRDRDWPMIRRLVEAHYVQNRVAPTPDQVAFWFRESRTPALLLALATTFPESAAQALEQRPLLEGAIAGDDARLAEALEAEEKRERELDRRYWAPLRDELERLRHQRQM